eukprot:8481924-Ditylum_brightwellii.AAC.1
MKSSNALLLLVGSFGERAGGCDGHINPEQAVVFRKSKIERANCWVLGDDVGGLAEDVVF